jgi:hypothetical protein
VVPGLVGVGDDLVDDLRRQVFALEHNPPLRRRTRWTWSRRRTPDAPVLRSRW